jgi:hypothetical protein
MEKAWRNHSFLMRSHLFPILILVTLFIITTASVALSQTDQYQTIKGVKFKDGSIVMGSIIQMNVETVTIRLDNGQTVVRKFGDVDTFIKQGDAVGSTMMRWQFRQEAMLHVIHHWNSVLCITIMITKKSMNHHRLKAPKVDGCPVFT